MKGLFTEEEKDTLEATILLLEKTGDKESLLDLKSILTKMKQANQQMETKVDKDVEEEYNTFWKEILEPKGYLDIGLVKNELFDFSKMIKNTTEVFYDITRGQISKPLTEAKAVLSVAKDIRNKEIEEILKDEKEIWQANADGLIEIEKYVFERYKYFQVLYAGEMDYKENLNQKEIELIFKEYKKLWEKIHTYFPPLPQEEK